MESLILPLGSYVTLETSYLRSCATREGLEVAMRLFIMSAVTSTGRVRSWRIRGSTGA